MKNKWLHSQRGDTFVLPLTSMVDMFTILLVFLLKSFSLAEYNIPPADGIRLPSSESTATTSESPILAIRKTEIQLGEHVFPSGKSVNGPLLKELKKLNIEKPIIVQADRDYTYANMYPVLMTLSAAGFKQIKMATVAQE